MKKISLFIVVVIACMQNINAFVVNGCEYSQLGGDSVEFAHPLDFSGNLYIPSTITYNDNLYRVTRIGYRAFFCNTSVTSIHLPSTISRLADGAFSEAYNLSAIYFTTMNPPILEGGYTFWYVPGTLFVPCGSMSDYIDLWDIEIYNRGADFPDDRIAEYLVDFNIQTYSIPFAYGRVKQASNCEQNSMILEAIPTDSTQFLQWSDGDMHNPRTIVITQDTTINAIFRKTKIWRNGLIFQLDYDNNVASVVSVRDLRSTNVVIPTSIEYDGNTYSVTTIGEYAFYGCSGLTSITIPNSVTTIGEYAFYGCSGLTSITIPNSVTTIGSSAFCNVNNIVYSGTATGSPWVAKCVNGYVDGYLVYSDATKTTLCGCVTNATGAITIPNSVTTIGSYAFSYCSGLTSPVYNVNCFAYMPTSYQGAYTIPDGIQQIAGYAFYNCSGLTSVTIPNSVTTIGRYAFSGCSGLTSVTIPNSVTTIGRYAFSGCSGLTSPVYNVNCFAYMPPSYQGAYTIPDGIQQIAGSAFLGCSGLTSITIPNSVTTIGDHAFRGCSGLTSVTIPNSVTTIGEYAFDGCSGLTSVTIPKSVTTIGYSAFRSCSGLTSVTIPNSVTTIGDHAFRGCSGLTKTNYTGTIADWCKIKFNSSYANPMYYSHNLFINDVEVKNLVIPEGVDTIGGYAFYSCSGLTSVTIPNSVTTIGNYAFRSCSGLTSVTIGNSVTTIGNYAFHSCSGLTSITIEATTPPTLGGNGVWPRPNCVFYIPCGTKTAYQEAWGYKTFIEPSFDYALTLKKSEYGIVQNTAPLTCANNVAVLLAHPQTGYHFTQWNDGNTDNPRSIVVTQDTTFTAEFAKNIYHISVEAEHGIVSGDGDYEYQSSAQLSAIADEHYHFVQWSDGNTNNPRTISVTEDNTYTAIFAIDQHTISATATYGDVEGTGTYEYGKQITLTITPDFCCEFIGWSDGNMDNPRTVIVTDDAYYEALCKRMERAQGMCGNNVYWLFDFKTGILTISGHGAMADYTSATQTPWYDYLNCATLTKLIIEDGITHIGDYAFYDYDELITISLPNSVATIGQYAFAECQNLEKVTLGAGLQSIGNYAFYNDIRIEEITCLASRTPDVETNTFYNVGRRAWVFVQSEYLHKYEVNPYWNVFVLKTIGAENTPISNEQVVTEPTEDNVTLTWPTNVDASTYTIEIRKGEELICTLVFNANGQLMSINFAAPARGGEHSSRYATATATGWTYTITGLEVGTEYTYTIVAKDNGGKTLYSETGSFKTTEIITSVENVDSQKSQVESHKFIRNGILYIERNGKLYNALGGKIK